MFKIADNINALLDTSMRNWETELVAHGQCLGTVKIKRAIFHENSLSPFHFSLLLLSFCILCVAEDEHPLQLREGSGNSKASAAYG